MTHLNNFYYLQVSLSLIVWFFWSIIRIYRVDGYKELLNWKNIRTFQMKTCATWILGISWILHFVYSSILTKIKYAEGFTVLPDGSVIYTPIQLYSPTNAHLATACDSLLDVVMAFKTSSLFMMVAGFHHILKTQVNQEFVSSREFHIFRTYSIISVIAYPILQAVYSSDPIRTAVAPQLWYCAENFVAISMLCIITYRMYVYVYDTQSDQLHTLSNRTLRSIIWSLVQLIGLLLMDFISFTILDSDALTPSHHINSDKFGIDLTSLFLNMGATWSNPAQIAVLYPYIEQYHTRQARGSIGGSPRITQKIEMTRPSSSATGGLDLIPSNTCIDSIRPSTTTSPILPRATISTRTQSLHDGDGMQSLVMNPLSSQSIIIHVPTRPSTLNNTPTEIPMKHEDMCKWGAMEQHGVDISISRSHVPLLNISTQQQQQQPQQHRDSSHDTDTTMHHVVQFHENES